MTAHARGCIRGDWLLCQPKMGLFWTVLFQEGPPCDCPGGATVQPLNSHRAGAGGAPLPPTGVNTEVRGVATS